MAQQEETFKKIVSHCKEYGFVFPSSEIYDGLGAVYDYGQMGVELKKNIKEYWWQSMVLLNDNIVGIHHRKPVQRKLLGPMSRYGNLHAYHR